MPSTKLGCITEAGPMNDTACSFPFKYKRNGHSYQECILIKNATKNTSEGFICFTMVNQDGVGMLGHWGYCGSKCPPLGFFMTI